VRVSGLAAASQLKMVFGQTRKNWAVSAPFQARTFLDLEDAESGGGGEVGSVLFGDPGEAGAEDVGGLPGEMCAQLGLLEPCVEGGEGVLRIAEVSEVSAGGDAKEAGGGEDGAQGELLGLAFEGDAEAEVDGRRGVDHAGLLSGEGRSLAWWSSPDWMRSAGRTRPVWRGKRGGPGPGARGGASQRGRVRL